MVIRLCIHLILTLIFIVSFHQQSPAQVAKLYPVDEADRDPSFFTFRARLLEAIQKRDTAFIISILSPNVKNGFGGNDGIEEFKKLWRPDHSDSEFWNTMMKVLALGGTFDGAGRFMAPYTYSKFPDEIDGFTHGAVLGENVRVRKEPALDGSVAGTLSYDIVKVVEWGAKQAVANNQNWVLVSLRDGAKGYVAKTYIRSPIDYRAGFEKRDGRWMLTFFVSGD
ncbi:MAG TPA: SH3 domain-containing protein [Blastocatellia bacterium]|nr:SH3 domain-containing protein [Blastocatellia bacterium]